MKHLIPCLLCMITMVCSCQAPWDPSTYPDEEGFKKRTEGYVERIAAATDFGEKSKAASRCPDTGKTVKTWAVEGETVISPYTGRAYVQGSTGYFGPKARGVDGRIIAFGGDPLKKDLPPAMATLMLDPENEKAHAYLSIPGNLRQQYHFACKNWCRFYPMLGSIMGDQWNEEFVHWIGAYTESRRPSDGYREHNPLATAHNLVGQEGALLGGNMKDGGTENHKTMWRTSALLYSQILPKGSLISGYSLEEANQLTSHMLEDYLQRTFKVGNGEYDSQIYYPHSMEAFMNLYDFSPDPETRLMARIALDYYTACFALKAMDGVMAGGQKRGNLPDGAFSDIAQFTSPWNRNSSVTTITDDRRLSIHMATTTYRPNKVISNIMEKNIPLPFEATMSRPLYHMNEANAFQEYFYCTKSYAMGSVYMTMVDNPNQQIVWSLVASGREGPLEFGGLQPYHRHRSGYTPFTQTLQYKGALLVVSGPTVISSGASREERQREKHASFKLQKVPVPQGKKLHDPEIITSFFEASKKAAATWFFIPKTVDQIYESEGKWFIRANQTLLCLSPLSDDVQMVSVEEEVADLLPKGRTKPGTLKYYDILVINGDYSGYSLECAELEEYGSLKNFEKVIIDANGLDATSFTESGVLEYKTLDGDLLSFEYQNHKLRCRGTINNQILNFENWNSGYVYRSPYLTIGDGQMWVSDGKDSYMVDYNGSHPVYSNVSGMPEIK